ncbi:hypothetical protein A7D16_19095 [Xanthomonas nasturtii]|uniref:LiaF transmembrane domain-containing protein n=1 Tax=Xanthomonas nasturtii TaxID=1843581 RepID=A0A3E1KGD7_9XANT|nr:hypothetical protein [Xanthomonas nasturtii]MCL1501154.1 hypothetical protein [Xanthomonas nasturtii]MCL1505274.1 hypothetical protein [Xanthomonas nasturtii]MCL1524788.1 hypothetical protein [Xanthomonas nasturtii]MCL1526716.1 hypothetical protein [Xanthomonas nasturtii]MCL1531856.1 hypothetical protein [Xanthomonas nasturtii]
MHYRLTSGLFLIVMSGMFLRNNLGLSRIDLGDGIAAWWPLLVIWAGVHQLMWRRKPVLAIN